MRILLVEDDHAIVRALTDLLEGEGFAVRSCATQDGACAALAADDFDIALLDVTLAQGNGFANEEAQADRVFRVELGKASGVRAGQGQRRQRRGVCGDVLVEA